VNRKRTVVSWSSGKDSAWTLHRLRSQNDVELVGLMTTVNQAFDRVAMHGTRADVLRAQADAAGLPLREIPLPWPCSNEQYQACMSVCVEDLKRDGVQAVAFGDLFLEDIRAYREAQLVGTGIQPLFPLWHLRTAALAKEMIAMGLKAKLVCFDPKKVDRSFAGRDFDAALLRDLPASVDACGENGEFHTCVYAGPMFRKDIPLQIGERVERDGFVYCDAFVEPGLKPNP
jgi:uncharacterized protein (TIGR00290 family)